MNRKKWIVPVLVLALVMSVAAPAMAKPAKKGPKSGRMHNTVVFVQHPITKKQRYAVAADTTASIQAMGWIRPKLRQTDDTTLTIVVQKRVDGKWVADESAETSTSLRNYRKDKKKTFYWAKVKVPVGKYRMKAKFEYVDDKGAAKVKYSSFTYFKVVTKK